MHGNVTLAQKIYIVGEKMPSDDNNEGQYSKWIWGRLAFHVKKTRPNKKY